MGKPCGAIQIAYEGYDVVGVVAPPIVSTVECACAGEVAVVEGLHANIAIVCTPNPITSTLRKKVGLFIVCYVFGG